MKCRPRTAAMLALATSFALLTACTNDAEVGTTGYVEADWLYVAAPAAGWLVNVPVAAGDRVSAGDLLFELDAASASVSS